MSNKIRVILTIVISLITFISVIVLTNDSFDEFAYKNAILITLVSLLMVIGLYNLYLSPRK